MCEAAVMSGHTYIHSHIHTHTYIHTAGKMAGTARERVRDSSNNSKEQRVFSCFDSSCPLLACSKNKLSGLLRHVRESHVPSTVPAWFIRKWELKICPCVASFSRTCRDTRSALGNAPGSHGPV